MTTTQMKISDKKTFAALRTEAQLMEVVNLETAADAWRDAARVAKSKKNRDLARENFRRVSDLIEEDEGPISPPAAKSAARDRVEAERPAKKSAKKSANTSRRDREAEKLAGYGVEIGATLTHSVRGTVVATAVYRSLGEWVVCGKTYSSVNKAADACAGYEPGGFSGYRYFGLEKKSKAVK